METLLKVVVSGLVIGAVNLIARRDPALGGWVAALPLITFLSVLWLAVDGRDDQTIAAFVLGVLWGLIPTTVLLAVVLLALRNGVPLLGAGLAGLAAWACVTGAARWVGLLG